MEMVYPAIEQYPSHLVNPVFERFAKESGDDQIKKKFIQSVALPHVKTLILELDSVSTSIIDDIISA